jgi:hypothetical protein
MVDDGSRFFSHWFPKDIRSARDIWIALGLSHVPAGVEKAPKPFQRPKLRDQGRGQAAGCCGCLERQIWVWVNIYQHLQEHRNFYANLKKIHF